MANKPIHSQDLHKWANYSAAKKAPQPDTYRRYAVSVKLHDKYICSDAETERNVAWAVVRRTSCWLQSNALS